MAIGVPMRSSQESRVDNGEEYLFESERQSPSKYNRKCMMEPKYSILCKRETKQKRKKKYGKILVKIG